MSAKGNFGATKCKRWLLLVVVAALCANTVREVVGVDLVDVSFQEQEPSERWHPGPTVHLSRRENDTIFMSKGDLFQVEGCPFAISAAEANWTAEEENASLGNIIELISPLTGRTGNHFMTLSAYIAMGYCCRSRLLTLPDEDNIIPSMPGASFSAGARWFKFSNVTIPWPEYEGLATDPETCPPEIRRTGSSAFKYENVHWKLMECMNHVYLRGCEKAYLGPLVDTDAFCPKQQPNAYMSSGTLVMHIRSGDIFKTTMGPHTVGFGQPPLQFYLHALQAKNWEQVLIITAASKDRYVNPTYTALEMMMTTGILGHNVHMHKSRPLLTDVQDMLCADGLVTARSSLSFLTFAHSRATTFYIPSSCGPGTFRRMTNPPVKATFENTTLLRHEKMDAEIYGVRWRQDSPDDYEVYRQWVPNPTQMLSMLTYEGMEGLQAC